MAILDLMVEFDTESPHLRYLVPTSINGVHALLEGGEFHVDQGDYDLRFIFPAETEVSGVEFGTHGALSFTLSKSSTSSTNNVVTVHDSNDASARERVHLSFIGIQPCGRPIPIEDPTVVNNPPIGLREAGALRDAALRARRDRARARRAHEARRTRAR